MPRSRSYEQSYPWLDFHVDLGRASPKFWRVLGEAVGYCRFIGTTPRRPDIIGEMNVIYLAKGVHATTAIEGNTLSEDQVRQAIRHELRLPSSQQYLEQEVQNILSVCNELIARCRVVPSIEPGSPTDLQQEAPLGSITVRELLEYNARVLLELPLDDDVTPGRVRVSQVGVARYRAPAAEECEHLLERMCEMLNGFVAEDPEDAWAYAILRAVLGHVYLALIHPFDDGNGRTARILEARVLLGAGIPIVCAHLLSDHYNKTRTMYYRRLDRVSGEHRQGSSAHIIQFLEYALGGVVDGLRAQHEMLINTQMPIAWITTVWHRFQDLDRPTDVRRQELALALFGHEDVSAREMLTLTPALAKLYAQRTGRTSRRDAAKLEAMGLVRITDGRVSPRLEILTP